MASARWLSVGKTKQKEQITQKAAPPSKALQRERRERQMKDERCNFCLNFRQRCVAHIVLPAIFYAIVALLLLL